MTSAYPVPFLKAATAARCGPMLSDEDRVIPNRRLLAVVRGVGGGETLLDELLAVRHHRVQPPALQVVLLSGTEAEAATEGRTSQPAEDFIQIGVHVSIPVNSCLIIKQAVATSSPNTCGDETTQCLG